MEDNMSLEIITRYKDIIDDGEISENLLTKIIKKVGFLDNLSVKCSNMASFVLVSEDDENVYQYFKSSEVANNIFFMISKIIKNPMITVRNFDKENNYNYKFTNNIVPFERYLPTDNIIIWKKIKPLNIIKPEEIPLFIQKNIYKILWDIGKAIVGLHNNYIIHGDISIDNIGIYRENNYMSEYKFVLFDFDASRNFFNYDDFSNDYHRFYKSIKYHYDIGKIPKKDVKLVDKIFSENSFLQSLLFSYMNNFFETDVGAMKSLENMKIKF